MKVLSIEFLLVSAAVAVIYLILFLNPITGVADNSDFARVTNSLGLSCTENIRFTNVVRYYNILPEVTGITGVGRYISSQLILSRFAIVLNKLLFSRDLLDIRFMGLVYSLLHITAVFLIFKGNSKRRKSFNILLGILLILVLCDLGYISYYNSFFGESALLVFLLLTAAALSMVIKYRKVTVTGILLFYTFALLFASSKYSNIPNALFLALFGFAFLFIKRERRILLTVILCSIALIGSSMFLYAGIPGGVKKANQYQTVFLGILKDSDTPEQDLEKLGFIRDLAVLKDTTYYEPNAPMDRESITLEKEFYSRFSFFNILKFYITNPARFIEKLEITAKNSTMIRPPYLGNYTLEDTGERLKFSNRFSLWSSFKKAYMPDSLVFTVLFFILYLAALAYEFVYALKSSRDGFRLLYICAFLLLWITAGVQFVIPILGNGEADLAKHLFLYNVCFDLMLVSAILWFAHKAALYGKPVIRFILRRSKMVPVLRKVMNIRLNCSRFFRSTRRRRCEYLDIQSDDNAVMRKNMLQDILKFILYGVLVITGSSIIITFASWYGMQAVAENGEENRFEKGDYISFGRHKGQNIIWKVVDITDDSIMLMSDKILCFKAFDTSGGYHEDESRKKYGSNLWKDSTLRQWLNSDNDRVVYRGQAPVQDTVWKSYNAYADEPGFLNSFEECEKDIINPVKHRTLISFFDRNLSQGGTRIYHWTNCVPLLIQNYYLSYYMTVEDRVYIPDVRELKEYVYDNNLSWKRTAADTTVLKPGYGVDSRRFVPYWLRTPYAGTSSMVRYAGSDGYVYHKDAYYSVIGVLPCLNIYSDVKPAKGDGSRKNPYIPGYQKK